MNWKIEYNNDTDANDEVYWEWWTVTNGDKSFKCDYKSDAEWLLSIITTHPQLPADSPRTDDTQATN